MSRLNKLIAELCPDGVVYKTISELCHISRGRVMSKGYLRDNPGKYPAYSSQTFNKGIFGHISSYDIDYESITWTTDGANAGSVFYHCGEKFSITNVCGLLRVKNNEIVTKFLFYVLRMTAQSYVYAGMGNPKLMSNVMSNVCIPLPPLPIQEEIVRILDRFTELETELKTKLETELDLRKKQYEYYRDELLTFDDDIEWKSLGEIATEMYRGSGIKRNQITDMGTPCVRYGEIYTTYNIWFDSCVSRTDPESIKCKKYFEYGDILFAITGESVDEIAKSCAYTGHDKCLAGGDIVVMKHNENAKYLAYVLSTSSAQAQKAKGRVKSKVVHSNIPAISNIKIPVPPLSEQERVVNILDRFDALTNDISVGLPAEISARHKQYEYYRDTLLSFKEKVS